MILADTLIWIDHFRRNEPRLQALLDRGDIIMHPFVLGEIALGSMASRRIVLGALDLLQHAIVASEAEVRAAIESRGLLGKGVGYVDAHLIASVLLTPGSKLWTRDKKLKEAAAILRLGADLP
jgi:hypothetical protein